MSKASNTAFEKKAPWKKRVGAGPFQIKRISLGSYSLKLHRYFTKEEWLEWVRLKDEDPEASAKQMYDDFERFFLSYPPGKIDYITIAPRSIRNLDKPHPMDDFVGPYVAKKLGVPFVKMFKPWEKKRRTRHVDHPDLELTEEGLSCAKSVVYVLDDVTVSNRTLGSCVRLLSEEMGCHAHGIAWVFYA